jgi:IK cytokine
MPHVGDDEATPSDGGQLSTSSSAAKLPRSMDNEAFRALVQERAKPKSTKEIAREAVEEEFQIRKKRKRGGGGSSSEDNDSDNDSNREPNKRDPFVPTVAKKKAGAEQELKYRDRAKERREGKNVDYQGQVTAVATEDGQMDQVTLSKYLGGDEAHTHLVKGLDVALARRVRREINKGITETNTKKLLPAKQTEKSTVIMVRDANEARELLQNVKIESISSELGQQILRCLKRSHLP